MAGVGLFVGIDNYKNKEIPGLQFAQKDASEVARMFQDAYSFRTFELLGENATREAIIRILAGGEFPDGSKLSENDRLLLFFAGHGEQIADGGYVLHPYDGVPGMSAFSLAMSDLRRFVYNRLPVKEVMLVMDACRNRPGGRGGVDTGMTSLAAREISVVAREPKGEKMVQILYGCEEGQQSWEDPELNHGVLSHHLMNVLAESRNAQEVDFEEVAKTVGEKMAGWTHSKFPDVRQTPAFWRPVNRRRILLRRLTRSTSDVRNPAISEGLQVSSQIQGQSIELTLWNSVKDSTDIEEVYSYIEANQKVNSGLWQRKGLNNLYKECLRLKFLISQMSIILKKMTNPIERDWL